ncbi:RMUA [Zea mays]|uniref:RMUA n=1 Tax=Zea mays TaxID=4577 RepID=A0A1D6GDZ2_MAIZE|nr:RMUA [Zea mays]
MAWIFQNSVQPLTFLVELPLWKQETTDFLCRMKEYIPSRSVFTDEVTAALGEHFSVQPVDLQAVLSGDEGSVPSTKLLSQQDLERNCFVQRIP